MSQHLWRAAAAVSFVLAAAPVSAQTAPAGIEKKLKTGDRLTVTTDDGWEVRGRLVNIRSDALLLRIDDADVQLAWDDVERIRRRRNGVLLGSLIGLGAGLATGIPLKSLVDNETGKGNEALATMIAMGVGAGMCLDAVLSTNRTIYRRDGAATSFGLQPLRGGGAVVARIAW
ncbi:MAG TPA: hypothetical protein VD833_09865 [Vicinamibacterales bacterium]|nr:hypothetical protein [Vicinamibacterales bacterium]